MLRQQVVWYSALSKTNTEVKKDAPVTARSDIIRLLFLEEQTSRPGAEPPFCRHLNNCQCSASFAFSKSLQARAAAICIKTALIRRATFAVATRHQVSSLRAKTAPHHLPVTLRFAANQFAVSILGKTRLRALGASWAQGVFPQPQTYHRGRGVRVSRLHAN